MLYCLFIDVVVFFLQRDRGTYKTEAGKGIHGKALCGYPRREEVRNLAHRSDFRLEVQSL